jgi:hypothetical protein
LAHEHYRRDQVDGISPPNLDDVSSYAEHIVHRRGKRTKFTSVSIDPSCIGRDWGDQLWRLNEPMLPPDGHVLIHHEELIAHLRHESVAGLDEARELAMRAVERARKRKEALVDWRGFELSRVERKERLAWAAIHVRPYFSKVEP